MRESVSQALGKVLRMTDGGFIPLKVSSLLLKQKTNDKTITGKTIKRIVMPVIVLSYWLRLVRVVKIKFHHAARSCS